MEKLYSTQKHNRLTVYHFIRNLLKQCVLHAPIALTKNERIDRQTHRVIKKVLQNEGIGVDVGAHKGKITAMMVAASPRQQHYAFEPIPQLFKHLEKKFNEKVKVYPYALSNSTGISTFNLVTTNMAYSSIRKRPYDRHELDDYIPVNLNTLDAVIPSSIQIQLIKIDVEGAEFLVLEGAMQTIQRCKPIVLFEFGKTGAGVYGIPSRKMFALFNQTLRYNIFTLSGWLQQKEPLTYAQFNHFFIHEKVYFFLAAPQPD
ncbi:MAG: FkbM family methyltransferase [Sphingobacteriales bacterium]|nr:MAG: FkbM family methyltransferase [Sphingobacteriales bacterium]